MNKLTFASLFTGGGGADLGASQAGYELSWGIEIDPLIADWASQELGHPVCAQNLLDSDPLDFTPVNLLHASPPCPNFSIGKAHSLRNETDNDRNLARKVAEFIAVLKPDAFTLENVIGYLSSESWEIIATQLAESGYGVTVEHLNMADYGVPQNRKRLIVRALRSSQYQPRPLAEVFPDVRPVGWYTATSDLFSELKRVALAPWQERLLRERYTFGNPLELVAQYDECSSHAQGIALLVPGDNSTSRMVYTSAEPANTVRATRVSPTRLLVAPSPEFPDGAILMTSARFFARIQTFPDSYQLPSRKEFALLMIGNAVPPAFYQQIATSLTYAPNWASHAQGRDTI